VVDLLADDGVLLTMSTDAHHEARVGRYDYVARTLAGAIAAAHGDVDAAAR
jgi:histidinol phosphatase-like PHP family hydrolase